MVMRQGSGVKKKSFNASRARAAAAAAAAAALNKMFQCVACACCCCCCCCCCWGLEQELLLFEQRQRGGCALLRRADAAQVCETTLLTRPRVTRSIIHAAQRPVVRYTTYTPAGSVASRRHAVVTQPHVRRTGTHCENCASVWPRGSGGSSRCRFMPGDCRAKNHTAACMNSSGRMM